jgi:hypothetical protein
MCLVVRALLSPGNRGKQRNQVPVIERGVQPAEKFHISAILEYVDKIPEGLRSGKNQIVQALIPPGELSEK